MHWIETQNEIRYQVLAITNFLNGSLCLKKVQSSPEITEIRGSLNGSEGEAVHEVRFPRKEWSEESAKEWIDKRKEKIMLKNVVEKINKSSGVQSILFLEKEFTEKSAKDFLISKGLDTANLQKVDGGFFTEINSRDAFQKGTLRKIIMRKGIEAWTGQLIEIQKSMTSPLLDEFALSEDDLHDLEDLDIYEVTLCKSPVVGVPAAFTIVKAENAPEQDFSRWCKIEKADKVKKQVFGYVLVPGVFDSQGDRLTAKEIEKACHSFMRNMAFRNQQGTGTGIEHKVFCAAAYPIENFFDEKGVNGVKGGWWAGKQIVDDGLWKAIEDGEINGFSVGGRAGIRKKAEFQLPLDVPKVSKSNIGVFKMGELEKLLNQIFALAKSAGDNQQALIPEAVMKFNMQPSQIAQKCEEGVNVIGALMGVEMIRKAVNASPTKGGDSGWTALKVIDIVKRGDYGEFGTTSFAQGQSVAKANPMAQYDWYQQMQQQLQCPQQQPTQMPQIQMPVMPNQYPQQMPYNPYQNQQQAQNMQHLEQQRVQLEKALDMLEDQIDLAGGGGVPQRQSNNDFDPPIDMMQDGYNVEDIDYDFNPMEFSASDAAGIKDAFQRGEIS